MDSFLQVLQELHSVSQRLLVHHRVSELKTVRKGYVGNQCVKGIDLLCLTSLKQVRVNKSQTMLVCDYLLQNPHPK